jgi:F-type H+-transporting ATPase subunit b
LINEQQSFGEEITRRTREQVFAIARKTLADLSSTTLEERMVDVFVRKLRGLDNKQKDDLKAAFLSASPAPVVRSAFDLPAPQRSAMRDAMKETLAIETPVSFQTMPDLVGGIELTASGRKIAWSIEDYLKSLDDGVRALLSAPAIP